MFGSGRQRTGAQKLRAMLTARITNLTRLNPTRVDLYERFQRLLEQYNAGSLHVQRYFDELVKLSHSLSEEEARAVSAGLSEEELAIFDLLTRPAPHLTADEEQQVKRVAEEVLAVLKREKLVLDWRKEQRTRAAVRVSVEETFGQAPGEVHAADLCPEVRRRVPACIRVVLRRRPQRLTTARRRRWRGIVAPLHDAVHSSRRFEYGRLGW